MNLFELDKNESCWLSIPAVAEFLFRSHWDKLDKERVKQFEEIMKIIKEEDKKEKEEKDLDKEEKKFGDFMEIINKIS